MRGVAKNDQAFEAWVSAEDESGKRLLGEARKRLEGGGLSVETVMAEGHPGEEILRAARERRVDLVVVGALGWQHRGFLVGSVTQKVETLAETDVLVVRRGAPLGDDPMRAVLAVDGSPESLCAVRSFAEKLQAKTAQVTVVQVLDLPPVTAWEMILPDRPLDVARLDAPLRAQVDAGLGKAMEILRGQGIEAAAEVWKGRAADGILAAADRHRAHLVAVGSRGLSGVRGLLLGSVARRVVSHGITSVLVSHSPRVD
jgi:nucleotide-binding universal stress UspA family protein